MRIHTNLLQRDLDAAAEVAGVGLDRRTEHRSSKRVRAFVVILSGNSPHRQRGGENFAATWDQWGIFLEYLWAGDPAMTCAAYPDHATFVHATGHRYDDLMLADQHRKHKWQPLGGYTSECDCGAGQRWDWKVPEEERERHAETVRTHAALRIRVADDDVLGPDRWRPGDNEEVPDDLPPAAHPSDGTFWWQRNDVDIIDKIDAVLAE